MPWRTLVPLVLLSGCAAPAWTTTLVHVEETFVVTGPKGGVLLNELGEHCPGWRLDGTVLELETERRRAPAAALVRTPEGEGPVVATGSRPAPLLADALPVTFEIRSLFDPARVLFHVTVDADGGVSHDEPPASHAVETDEGRFEVVETFEVRDEGRTPVRAVDPRPCE